MEKMNKSIIDMLQIAHDYIYLALTDPNSKWSFENKYGLCQAQELVKNALKEIK